MESARSVFCNLEEGDNASFSFKSWPKTGADLCCEVISIYSRSLLGEGETLSGLKGGDKTDV